MCFLLESLELQLPVPVGEMSMWLVFKVIWGYVVQTHETADFWVLYNNQNCSRFL